MTIIHHLKVLSSITAADVLNMSAAVNYSKQKTTWCWSRSDLCWHLPSVPEYGLARLLAVDSPITRFILYHQLFYYCFHLFYLDSTSFHLLLQNERLIIWQEPLALSCRALGSWRTHLQRLLCITSGAEESTSDKWEKCYYWLVNTHTNDRTWHTVFLVHFSMIKVEATIDYTQQWFHDKKDMIAKTSYHMVNIWCVHSLFNN